MLTYLRDILTSARLRARYQRLVSEQLLNIAESTQSPPTSEDPSRWTLLAQPKPITESARTDLRNQVRQLVTDNPHAKNLLRLLEIYVVGPGLKLTHAKTQAAALGSLGASPAPTPPTVDSHNTNPLSNHACGFAMPSSSSLNLSVSPSPHPPLAPSPNPLLLQASSHPFAPLQTPSHPNPSPLADSLWQSFLTHNHRHYSFREHARRTWRDGEAFLRLFPSPTWPPTLRFLDP